MPNAPKNLLDYLRDEAGAWRNEPHDDADLMTRFVDKGDETAFRVLVRRHGPLVWRSCIRVLGNGSKAEDAFQNTFLALVRKVGQLRRGPLAGWLCHVARRTAVRVDIKTRKLHAPKHHLFTPPHATADEDTSRPDLYAVLKEELKELPEHLRIPLVLIYLEGKTVEEVARIIGCSRPALEERLEQGETVLCERLKKCGMENRYRVIELPWGRHLAYLLDVTAHEGNGNDDEASDVRPRDRKYRKIRPWEE